MSDDTIASGFKEDCCDFIKSFIAKNDLNFQLFCEEWKRRNFHYIFIGHTFHHELVQYIENCFLTLKNLFTTLNSTTDRVVVLYLMYALYYKQPTKDLCKFRFTYADWIIMKRFYSNISQETNFLEARMIFWRLFQGNAFRFVQCDSEQVAETPRNQLNDSAKDNKFSKINETIQCQIGDLCDKSKGLLSAIDILHIGYNEMKEHFVKTMKDSSGLLPTNLNEINAHINNIESYFEEDFSKIKRKRKRKMKENTNKSAPEDEETFSSSESDYDERLLDNIDAYVDSEVSDDSDIDCLNIGSKRIYLKRKAMNKGNLNIKSSPKTPTSKLTEPSTSQNVALKIKQKRNTIAGNAKVINPPNTDNESISKISSQNESIVMISAPKQYNRQWKKATSLVRKQFANDPLDLDSEIDVQPTRKKLKRSID